MNYQMWDQHWGWRNEPHNDDVKMILWTVFLVHCNFVKFILFAASCQRSVCNASILNGTSWCKSRWGCCPFKESDAGIPNLVLSPSLGPRRVLQSKLTFASEGHTLFPFLLPRPHICFVSSLFGHPRLLGRPDSWLFVDCLFAQNCLDLQLQDKSFKMHVKSWIIKEQFIQSKASFWCVTIF